ncbi:terminase small subunit [Paenibacillus sp. DS2015]|uniref:terminase small subunit n=1 Tax=Paenibacillus sp. DS2015 TaxID=3373917 RepID=UPI003D1AD2CA
MALTAKQKTFVQEYLIDLNATQAAIRARYSIKTAEQQASRLLSNVKVQEAIQKAMGQREKRTEITQDRVLQELAKIGFSNISDYLSVNTSQRVVAYKETDDGERVPITDWVQLVEVFDTEVIDRLKMDAVSEIKQTKEGISLKLHDKVSALEKIGRHLGMFVDKVQHSGTVEVNNPLKDLSTEELRKLIRDG